MSRGRRRAWRSRHRVKLGGGWIVAMSVMLAAAVLFTGAVMLGNHLRAEAEATDGESREAETTLPDFDASGVPSVIARYAVFGSDFPRDPGRVPAAVKAPETGTTAGEATGTADTQPTAAETADSPAPDETKYSYNAYCVVMRGADGELYYHSDVRDRLFGAHGDSATAGAELKDGISRFGGAYVSAIFGATYGSASGAVEAMREYEISLAAEIADAGFGDILVTGLDFGQDAADFCAAIKGRIDNSDCRVGIALGYDFLSSESARESLVRLGGSFDFIALDLGTVTDAAEIDALLHNVRALIGIYHMRILVGSTPGLAAAALDAGAVNVAETAVKSTAR